MKHTYTFIFLAAFFSPCTALFATTYYVSNSGNNANSGLSPAYAFATIQHAADQVGAGDSVLVADGTYAGFDFRYTNGTAADPIVFAAMGNSCVINDNGPIREDAINIEEANYVYVLGFICKDMVSYGNGIRVVTSNNCIVRGNKCENNGRGIFTGFTDDILIENNICRDSWYEHGIYVSNSSDRPVVRHNSCYNNTKSGIHMNGDESAGGDGIISDPEIYGNRIYENNLGSGINLDGVEGALIYNNLIYDNHSCQGIVLFQTDGAIMSYGAKIYNNTIIVPSDGRWGILLQDGSNVQTVVKNNIIINLHSFRGCLGLWSTTGFESDYNIFNDRLSTTGDDAGTITLADWQLLGLDPHSLVADNMTDIFVNPGTDDYHLKTGSQAIDAGTALASVSVDYDNLIRPWGTAYDIGAYEYGSVLETGALESSIRLTVYPNPASDYIVLEGLPESATGSSVNLWSTNGKLVANLPVSSTGRVNVSGVPSGLYFLQVNSSPNVIRLVIQ